MARRKTYIRFEGLEELQRNLDKIGDKTEKMLKDTALTNAESVLNTAKSLVPVNTGALQRSLAMKEEKSQKKGKKVYQIYSKGEREGGVRYGFMVEWGGKEKNYQAHPFMRPALKKNKQTITNNFRNSINQALEG